MQAEGACETGNSRSCMQFQRTCIEACFGMLSHTRRIAFRMATRETVPSTCMHSVCRLPRSQIYACGSQHSLGGLLFELVPVEALLLLLVQAGLAAVVLINESEDVCIRCCGSHEYRQQEVSSPYVPAAKAGAKQCQAQATGAEAGCSPPRGSIPHTSSDKSLTRFDFAPRLTRRATRRLMTPPPRCSPRMPRTAQTPHRPPPLRKTELEGHKQTMCSGRLCYCSPDDS